MVARIIIIGAFAVAFAALVIYAIVWLYEEHTDAAREAARLEHKRRMAREERDYDTVVSYAEQDTEDDDGG